MGSQRFGLNLATKQQQRIWWISKLLRELINTRKKASRGGTVRSAPVFTKFPSERVSVSDSLSQSLRLDKIYLPSGHRSILSIWQGLPTTVKGHTPAAAITGLDTGPALRPASAFDALALAVTWLSQSGTGRACRGCRRRLCCFCEIKRRTNLPDPGVRAKAGVLAS